MSSLVFGQDELVARWVFETFDLMPIQINMAIGIIDQDFNLIGGTLFYWWNGSNVYFGYYGPKTMTLGIMKTMARVAIEKFEASRVTIHTRKTNRRLIKGLIKTGAQFEGASRRYYGDRDIPENTAVQYVVFRPVLERWAAVRELEDANG